MVRDVSSWFVMFHCHGFVMVHHGSSWFTVMVRHGSLSWFRHGSLSWFVMVHCHGSSWLVMVHCHGFIMVRDVLFSKILQKKVM